MVYYYDTIIFAESKLSEQMSFQGISYNIK